MEITARPRRRGWLRALRAVLGVGAVLAVALLIPPALGFQTHVVHDDAMAGTHERGALVFGEQVPAPQLEVGDVVTFVPPGADPADGSVTRRIVAIGDAGLRTQGDAAAAVDAWRVPLASGDLERVAYSLPWAGYPVVALGPWAVPAWTPAVLALGLATGLVLLRRSSRPVVEPEPDPDSGGARPRSGGATTQRIT